MIAVDRVERASELLPAGKFMHYDCKSMHRELYLQGRHHMATLQVRDLDDRLYNFLKTSARLQNRSISQEVITMIEQYVNSPVNAVTNSTLDFLSMSGAWKDDRSADSIVGDIRAHRSSPRRFGADDGLFD
jgi:hypothetical protein